MEVRRNLSTVTQSDGSMVVVDYLLLDAFLWAPDLVFLSAGGTTHGAAAVAGAAADIAAGELSGVAETAGGVVEGAGEVAGSVF